MHCEYIPDPFPFIFDDDILQNGCIVIHLPDVLVGMVELCLTLVHHDLIVLIPHHGVLDDAVMAGRHGDHAVRPKHNALIVLPDERLWPDLQPGYVLEGVDGYLR